MRDNSNFDDEHYQQHILKIYSYVLANWNFINNQENTKNLNCKKNQLCLYIKFHNPDLSDDIIQAYIYSHYLYIYYFLLC